MTDYEQGDVILVPFGFAGQPGGWKRPALVVSSTQYNQETGELVIAQITSRRSSPSRVGDYLIEAWRESNLPHPALVRARLATIDASQVLGKLGKLPDAEFQAAQAGLQSVFVQGD